MKTATFAILMCSLCASCADADRVLSATRSRCELSAYPRIDVELPTLGGPAAAVSMEPAHVLVLDGDKVVFDGMRVELAELTTRLGDAVSAAKRAQTYRAKKDRSDAPVVLIASPSTPAARVLKALRASKEAGGSDLHIVGLPSTVPEVPEPPLPERVAEVTADLDGRGHAASEMAVEAFSLCRGAESAAHWASGLSVPPDMRIL